MQEQSAVARRPWQSGENNGSWKGGRTIDPRGYVLVKVGFGHHLADIRGYAYEHRIVAEGKLGRRLEPWEIVHHKNEDKSDNSPDNLEVVQSTAEHFLLHRKKDSNRRLPGEPNEQVMCKCGCGGMFLKFDEHGRPRKYISGHNPQPSPTEDSLLTALADGPLPRHILIAQLGLSHHAVAVSLSKLKRKGLVYKIAHGVWARTALDCRARQYPEPVTA